MGLKKQTVNYLKRLRGGDAGEDAVRERRQAASGAGGADASRSLAGGAPPAPALPDGVPAMPVTRGDPPEHRPIIPEHEMHFNACVARPVNKKEVASNPKALEAVLKEWRKLRDAWCLG